MVGEDLSFVQITPHMPTQRAYERLVSTHPYVHLHEYIGPDHFSNIWSRYDAGFMHPKVDPIDRAFYFERMNLPNRYTAYLAAGLPLAVPREGQEAMLMLIKQHGIGYEYSDFDDLAEHLYDDRLITALTLAATSKRKSSSFDRNVAQLVQILATYARA
jgi:hypothetical protein